MFCLECGQPIEEQVVKVRNLDGDIIRRDKYYYHTTADTYPQLNDHEARPGG